MTEIPQYILDAIAGVRKPSKKHLPCPPPGCCWWCHKPITAKRRSTWCGKACADAFVELIAPPVYERDNGFCQICGMDTKQLTEQLAMLRKHCHTAIFYAKAVSGKYLQGPPHADDIMMAKHWRSLLLADAKAYPDLFTTDEEGGLPRLKRQHAYEIDHIVPVSQGGLSIMSNLRTLCISCHERETRQLAGKRAYTNAKERARERNIKKGCQKGQHPVVKCERLKNGNVLCSACGQEFEWFRRHGYKINPNTGEAEPARRSNV